MIRKGVLLHLQPEGVAIASIVLWQRTKHAELRLSMDMIVQINGNSMDEDYQIAHMETIFPSIYTLPQ